ncbi:trihelix transcription factor PTL-like [Cynara cardunculus var. scolymus]|uniref:trihelix transcription factor PTL-like n=1 Tax=Cynara cardunculus var. scolymus TaxID=59895 RepID=UPI000D629703|nr:trihelix transcription factor PTL-like [Cynara cardunculus var. scolymus]
MHQMLNPNDPPQPPAHTFHDNATTVSPPTPPPPPYLAQTGWNAGGGGVINLNHRTNSYAASTTIRWPRQETLSLLEIRSRLDSCFREASSSNHKAPLWDEISRIMNDEYGYQRSGRKCKEKFENLYKYYKKTKDGKVGKHDGKHYRFFGQLEALFGDQQRTTVAYPISQSNYSSEYGTPSNEKNRRTDYEFETDEFIAAIQDSIDSQLSKLMVKQDEWGEKILCAIDRKDQERVVMDEEWRKREAARLAHEYESWANHVARIETRDKSLLDALQNLIRVRSRGSSYRDMDPVANPKGNECSDHRDKRKDWSEPEISSLIHIRINKDGKFRDGDQEDGERIWEEIAFELSLLGYNRNGIDCKEAWEKLCVDFNKSKMECEIVSKEVSSRTSNAVDDNDDRNSCLRAMTMNIDGER